MWMRLRSNHHIAKKTALFALLISVAFVFSYIEFLIPINFGIPGIKLGLSNIVVMFALYQMKPSETFLIAVARMVISGLLFGGPLMLLYSFCGGAFSLLVMLIFRNRRRQRFRRNCPQYRADRLCSLFTQNSHSHLLSACFAGFRHCLRYSSWTFGGCGSPSDQSRLMSQTNCALLFTVHLQHCAISYPSGVVCLKITKSSVILSAAYSHFTLIVVSQKT